MRLIERVAILIAEVALVLRRLSVLSEAPSQDPDYGEDWYDLDFWEVSRTMQANLIDRRRGDPARGQALIEKEDTR